MPRIKVEYRTTSRKPQLVAEPISTNITQELATVKLLRLPPVLDRRGVGRSKHYGDIQAGLFTPPINASARSVAWPEHEVDVLVAARIAGKSDDEIRRLVRRLVSQRSSVLDAMLAAAYQDPKARQQDIETRQPAKRKGWRSGASAPPGERRVGEIVEAAHEDRP